ncbi:MAG: hypothetical protein AAFX00_14025, partial [Pseudomonadota bacterium]
MKDLVGLMALQGTGPREDVAQKILSKIDEDGSGGISLDEVVRGGSFSDRFNIADADSDGEVTADELKGMFKDLAEERGFGALGGLGQFIGRRVSADEGFATRLMDTLDTDGSGDLRAEELADTRLADRLDGDLARIDLDKDGAVSGDELQR